MKRGIWRIHTQSAYKSRWLHAATAVAHVPSSARLRAGRSGTHTHTQQAWGARRVSKRNCCTRALHTHTQPDMHQAPTAHPLYSARRDITHCEGRCCTHRLRAKLALAYHSHKVVTPHARTTVRNCTRLTAHMNGTRARSRGFAYAYRIANARPVLMLSQRARVQATPSHAVRTERARICIRRVS